MPLRLLANAGAQTTAPSAITAAASSIVGASTANFPAPATGQQFSLTILDSGNPGFNAAAPLATPFEYCYCTTNTTGTNTLSGLTRGVASTTARAFFAGATLAVGLLAEDIVASATWKMEEQTLSGAAQCLIPASGVIPTSYLGITWRHLDVRYRLRTTAAPNGNASLFMQFNGDATGNYGWAQFYNIAPGTPAYNEQFSQTWIGIGLLPQGGATANMFGQGDIKIEDYGGPQVKKARGWSDGSYGLGTPGLQTTLRFGFYNSTNAITAIRLFPSDGSTFSGEVTTYLTP